MRQPQGMGAHTIYQIKRWVSGSTLFIGAEAMVKIGVFSGVIFALAGVLAILLFAIFQERFFKETLKLYEGTFEENVFTRRGRVGYHILLFLATLFVLYLEILVGTILIYSITGISFIICMVIFLLLSYVLLRLDYFDWSTKYSIFLVGLVHITTFLLLIYTFFLTGIVNIFNGVQLYHPYLLFYRNPDVIKFFAASLITMLGRFLLDWLRMDLSVTPNSRTISFVFSGLIWTTLPISFSALMLSSIYKGKFTDFRSLIYSLIHLDGNNVIATLFAIFLILMVFSTFLANLGLVMNYFGSRYKAKDANQQIGNWFKRWLTIAMSILTMLCLTIVAHPTILEVLYVSSLFFIPVIIPVVFTIKMNVMDNGQIFCISILSLLIGYITYGFENFLTALIIVSMISSIMSFVFIRTKVHLNVNKNKAG